MLWLIAVGLLVGALAAEVVLSERMDADVVGVISALGAFGAVGIVLALVLGLV